MKKQEVIDHFGTIRKAAHALDLSVQTIYQWGEDVPKMAQYRIQVLTKNKLKADKE